MYPRNVIILGFWQFCDYTFTFKLNLNNAIKLIIAESIFEVRYVTYTGFYRNKEAGKHLNCIFAALTTVHMCFSNGP